MNAPRLYKAIAYYFDFVQVNGSNGEYWSCGGESWWRIVVVWEDFDAVSKREHRRRRMDVDVDVLVGLLDFFRLRRSRTSTPLMDALVKRRMQKRCLLVCQENNPCAFQSISKIWACKINALPSNKN
jgi:hypothetical protein